MTEQPTLKLYRIQDADRPMHVVAMSMLDALETWRDRVAMENHVSSHRDAYVPDGIEMVTKCVTPMFPDLLLSMEAMELVAQEVPRD